MARDSGPRIFRILLPARDLDEARQFYERLLGLSGRSVAPGRIYFDCGTVILGLLDFSSVPRRRRPVAAEPIYLATGALEDAFRRARRLRCLSTELLHGDRTSPLGEIRVRPWGERSFYASDPTGNPLCFVDDQTLFTGSRRSGASRRSTAIARRPRPLSTGKPGR